ncbi:hypothetical protein Acy02nite_17220 [Actinoplanes cyaneus]|uniref:Novel STAND NTPase 5 domain-containing protein n=1 Tax=Actinoplanes cyaneus TaxID=52696 RepID=A0A919IEP4_9ACTN|nr:AAA family ATPase [Actinoplanes cyaneus]MCW2142002.1 hypothetical protein [Actinoplanes cyaneus]GID63841.1 hypothetical protein Acy02nite_17220 [Actinoplanes cyaneus]
MTGPSPGSRLEQRIRLHRQRSFAGRADHLATLRAALERPGEDSEVFYLCGPGGIGKSTLLRRVAYEAEDAGRSVLRLRPGDADAGIVTGGSERAVILLDDVDHVERRERWLRGFLLSADAPGAMFVVASRRPPSPGWRADPGWAAVLRVIALEPFTDTESDELLAALGIPHECRADVRSAARGNPLALRLAADAVTAGAGLSAEDLRREVAVAAFDELIGEIPSGAHRRALQAAALAPMTTEDLLRAVVAEEESAQLFAWLRDQPFMAVRTHGLSPGDTVRMVVRTELRWRDPQAYEALCLDVKEALADREPSAERAAVTTWTRADFDDAVRQALRTWHRADLLADSRLAGSRMVRQRGGEAVAALRHILRAALAVLGTDVRRSKHRRAVEATYLTGALTQEAAAERLGLPFSTYRRHLARGTEELCAILWRAETQGLAFLDEP